MVHFELLVLSRQSITLLLGQQGLIQNASIEAVLVPGMRRQRTGVARAIRRRMTVLHVSTRHHLVVAGAHSFVALHVQIVLA